MLEGAHCGRARPGTSGPTGLPTYGADLLGSKSVPGLILAARNNETVLGHKALWGDHFSTEILSIQGWREKMVQLS